MVVFISPPYLHSGIINSQLLKIAEYSSKKSDVTVLIFGKKANVESTLVLREDIYQVFYYSTFAEIYPYIKKARVVYLRHISYLLKIILLNSFRIINVKIVYDFRALTYKESWYRNKNIVSYIVLYFLEFLAYASAERVCAVSKSLSISLSRSFFKREVSVIPCAIEEVKLKSRVNVQKSLSFVYSGSMSRWQNFEEVLRFFSKISRQINCDLSVFTPDLKEANELISKHKVQVKEIKTLRSSEVKERLGEFDFGFLLRENLFLNRTASPIKFLEYISSGVIPVMTKYVGDYSNEVITGKFGYIHEIGEEPNLEMLLTLYNDQDIYKKLYNYSLAYRWDDLMNKHPLNRL